MEEHSDGVDGLWTSKKPKHTTGGIPRWSPTLVLVALFSAYVWQSGRNSVLSLHFISKFLELTSGICNPGIDSLAHAIRKYLGRCRNACACLYQCRMQHEDKLYLTL
jgi:hypothetical protein